MTIHKKLKIPQWITQKKAVDATRQQLFLYLEQSKL